MRFNRWLRPTRITAGPSMIFRRESRRLTITEKLSVCTEDAKASKNPCYSRRVRRADSCDSD